MVLVFLGSRSAILNLINRLPDLTGELLGKKGIVIEGKPIVPSRESGISSPECQYHVNPGGANIELNRTSSRLNRRVAWEQRDSI